LAKPFVITNIEVRLSKLYGKVGRSKIENLELARLEKKRKRLIQRLVKHGFKEPTSLLLSNP